jgi:hypothetical protein
MANRQSKQRVLEDLSAMHQNLNFGSDDRAERFNCGSHQIELLTDVMVDGLVSSGDENFVSLKVVGRRIDPIPLAIEVLFMSADRVGVQTLVALDGVKAVEDGLDDGFEVRPVLGSQ